MVLLSPIFLPFIAALDFWQSATLKEQTAAPSLSLNANFYSLLVLLFFWLLPVVGGAHPPLSSASKKSLIFLLRNSGHVHAEFYTRIHSPPPLATAPASRGGGELELTLGGYDIGIHTYSRRARSFCSASPSSLISSKW